MTYQIHWTLNNREGFSPYALTADEAAADIKRRQAMDQEAGVERVYELVAVDPAHDSR